MAKIKTRAVIEDTADTLVVPVLENLLVADIIGSPLNPRKVFDQEEISELSESIKKNGLIQAITVRKSTTYPGKYETVCGERRLRATAFAGLKTILASVRDLTDQEAMELMVTENLQRKDVHAMEETNAFRMMIDQMGYTITDIAAKIGKNEPFVLRRLQLMELIDGLKAIFQGDILPIGHAELLSRIAKQDQLLWFTNKYSDKYQGGVGNLKTLKEWISRAEPELSNAQFDIDKIFEGERFITPQCTMCSLNSSVHTSLFPDQADQAICHNSHCFEAKADYTFNARLNEAMEDPSTIFIDEYYGDRTSLKEDLKKGGYTVLKKYEDYDIVSATKVQRYNGDSDELVEKRQSEADTRYNDQLSRSVKAFIFAGDKRGTYVDVIPRKVVVTDSDKLTANKIADLQQKKRRGIELDQEKLMTRLVAHMKAIPDIITSPELSAHELNCLIALAYDKNGGGKEVNQLLGLPDGYYTYGNGPKLVEAISKASLEVRAKIVRRSIFYHHTSIVPNALAGGIIFYLANDWCPDELKLYKDEQEAIKLKRESRLNERIAELNKAAADA